MNPYRAIILGLLTTTSIVACAPAMFEKPIDCGDGCKRVIGRGVREIEYRAKVTGGVVDILFVADNSGSMSYEQGKMAARFSTFLSSLDSQYLDYRIAITTTDISDGSNPPRPINGNGALQDGRLIRFANGAAFLDNNTSNKQNLFNQAISRGETWQCEDYLRKVDQGIVSNTTANYQANCPAADERGIFASRLVVENNPDSFIRGGDVHLAIVFLSDEDERSGLYDQTLASRLSEKDLPQNLMEAIRQRYPGKGFSIHSMIVSPGPLKSGIDAGTAATRIAQVVNQNGSFNQANRPMELFVSQAVGSAREQCLAAQGNQTPGVRGSYGYLYALATRMTSGIEGSICDGDYGAQLTAIGSQLGRRGRQVVLACSDAKVLELRFSDSAGGTPTGSVQGSIFVINDSVALGREIYLKVECPDL